MSTTITQNGARAPDDVTGYAQTPQSVAQPFRQPLHVHTSSYAPWMVYFIQSGKAGPVKIGASASPFSRLSALRGSGLGTLRLIAVVDGGPELEAKLQDRFRQKRLAGEWFMIGHDDIARAVGDVIRGKYAHLQSDADQVTEMREHEQARATTSATAISLDLVAIRRAFDDRERITSAELAVATACTPKQLAVWLEPYDISPKIMRFGDRVARGYRVGQFAPIWETLDRSEATK